MTTRGGNVACGNTDRWRQLFVEGAAMWRESYGELNDEECNELSRRLLILLEIRFPDMSANSRNVA